MQNHLAPALFMLVLPALYLSHRTGWLSRRWGRWTVFAVLAAIVVWSLPYQGLDFRELKIFNLVLALATALLLLLRHHRVSWILKSRNYLAALTALAALALLNYCNYFAFHGARTFVHLHDVCHYYLGSKYYAELGYGDLYTAMLRAEAEEFDNHFKAIEARDLVTYDQVHIKVLLRQSDTVKAAFTPERWQAFKKDAMWFRQALGAQYGTVLLDHGFNPTPVWALLGGSLAQLVPAGSARGLLLLSLLDVVLLAVLAGIVRRTFGLSSMLLAVIFFCITFGATFGWTGGAFLRYLWFFGVVAGFCALSRRRYGQAGGLLALAAGLRVFPLFFVLPLLLKAVAVAWHRQRLPRQYVRFFTGLATSGVVLFLLTGLLPRGFMHWLEFRDNMQTHLANISPNVLGLTEALAFQTTEKKVTAEEFNTLKERRQRIYRAQLLLVFLPAVLVVGLLSRRRRDPEAMLLALPLLYVGLSLAAYYYAFLVLLVLARRGRAGDLSLIFAVEALPYALMLFEGPQGPRESVLYIERGLLLVFLFAALLLHRMAPPSDISSQVGLLDRQSTSS